MLPSRLLLSNWEKGIDTNFMGAYVEPVTRLLVLGVARGRRPIV